MSDRKEFDIVKVTGYYETQDGEKKKYGNLGRLTVRTPNGQLPDDLQVFIELTSEMIPIPGMTNPVSAFEKKPR